MPLAASSWMDLEKIILSEVSQTEKDKYMTNSHVESDFFKNDINELIYKTETDPQISKKTYGYQRGNMGGRDKLGAWD